MDGQAYILQTNDSQIQNRRYEECMPFPWRTEQQVTFVKDMVGLNEYFEPSHFREEGVLHIACYVSII